MIVPDLMDAAKANKLSGKQSQLLALPAELRMLIYESIFNTNPKPRDEIYIDHDKTGDDALQVLHDFDCSLINVQLTCRGLFKETNPVFYRHLHVIMNVDSEQSDRRGLLHHYYRSRLQRLSSSYPYNFFERERLFPAVANVLFYCVVTDLFDEDQTDFRFRFNSVKELVWLFEPGEKVVVDERASFGVGMKALYDQLLSRVDRNVKVWFVLEHKWLDAGSTEDAATADDPVAITVSASVRRSELKMELIVCYAQLARFDHEVNSSVLSTQPQVLNQPTRRETSRKGTDRIWDWPAGIDD